MQLPVNLCFHGIGRPRRDLEDGEDRYWLSESFFLEVLDLVAGRKNVGISFDDSNASDVEIALPALAARGLRATFFPIAVRLGRPGSLSGDDLRELVRCRMAIGSHGMYHRPWRRMTRAEADVELVTARDLISGAAGVPIKAAACPLGAYDRSSLGHLRRLGYHTVFTSDRSRARPGAWLQPRYSLVREDDSMTVQTLLDAPFGAPERLRTAMRTTVKRWR